MQVLAVTREKVSTKNREPFQNKRHDGPGVSSAAAFETREHRAWRRRPQVGDRAAGADRDTVRTMRDAPLFKAQ
ncbi:hypothetical protein O9K51_06856 [Purpureocillium lavendulum]|uniref:Uncharacterized protein n=1 Tax=Purpureocillium lavendulum TaxID=1247861 RepID=A0AB34FRU5_9HYPO|nr:hypothetical protein O9K51_06856 [Purpureocillium lavendulum]